MPTGDAPGPAIAAEPPPEAPSVQALPSVRPKPARSSYLRYLLPAICLFQLGVIIGLSVLWIRGRAPENPKPSVDGAEPESRAPVTEGPHATSPPAVKAASNASEADVTSDEGPTDQARADDKFREADYERALSLFRRLQAKAVSPLREILQYRMALCLEGLSRNEQALAAYRDLAGREASPRTAAAARLGQARIYERLRRPTEAKSLLYGLLLRSADPVLRDGPVLSDARYMAALALALDAQPAEKPGPLNEAVAHAVADWRLERALEWGTPTRESRDAPNAKPEEGIFLSSPVERASEGFFTVFVRQISVQELIEGLAKKARCQVDWTPEAKQLAQGRSLSVQVERVPLANLLRAVADPFGLVWQIEKPTAGSSLLRVVAEQELTEANLRTYRILNAQRALQEAVVSSPGHFLEPMAYLELGNLAALDTNWDPAAAFYRRAADSPSGAMVVREAHYNLGLALARRQQFAQARDAFYRVVDESPGHELTPLAYLRIGRLHLIDGSFEQALRPLRRALATASGAAEQATAAITLAAGYLITGNPPAARLVLQEARVAIAEEPYRPVATFLDCYARYRAVLEPRLRSREASDLLAALLGVRQDPVLQSVGQRLMGQAYRELGLGEQMAAIYERALPTAPAPVAAEMKYYLAEHWQKMDDPLKARQLFAELAQGESSPWRSGAQLHLAEIALTEKRPKDCLAWCQALVQDRGTIELPAVLKLMGRAYEQTGDYRQAARCFAGQLPNP